jgi:hypothetical protein
VFVDDSGRRLRRVRKVGWLVGVLAGLYVALMIASVLVPPGTIPESLPRFRSAAPTRPDWQRRPLHQPSSILAAGDAATGSTGLGRHGSDTGSLELANVGVAVHPAANPAPAAPPTRVERSASIIPAVAPTAVASRARSEPPRRAGRDGTARSTVGQRAHPGSNGANTTGVGSRGRSALAPGRL